MQNPVHILNITFSHFYLVQAETLPLQYDPAFFISLLLNANYTVLVAKSKDGSIVACATAFLNPYLHELELLTLCVDPKHVRNGKYSSSYRTQKILPRR